MTINAKIILQRRGIKLYTDRKFILGLIVIALSIILIAMTLSNAHAETYNYTVTDLFASPLQLQVGDSINVFNDKQNTQYVYANESQNMVNTGLLHPNQTASLHFMYNGTWDMRNIFNPSGYTTVQVGGSFPVMKENTTQPVKAQPTFSAVVQAPTLQFDESNSTNTTAPVNSTQPILSSPIESQPVQSTNTINFTDSNGTETTPVTSQSTTETPSLMNQSGITNDTVAYWEQKYQTEKSQADYWQNMYDNLLGSLRSLIGGL